MNNTIKIFESTTASKKHRAESDKYQRLIERQIKAILFIKEKGKITNKEYQKLNSTSERTATRDLTNLVKKQILKSSEIKGAGSYFYLESY